MNVETSWRDRTNNKLVPRDELATFNVRRNAPGLIFFIGHLLAMLCTGTLLHFSLNSIWVVPCTILHGVVIVYWFQPFHEAAHGTPFRSAGLNQALSWFAGVLVMLTPTYFYHEHMRHHRYTQHPKLDPERIPLADSRPGYWLYLTGLPYFFYICRALILHSLGRFDTQERGFLPASARPLVIRQSRILCLIYAAVFVVSLLGFHQFLVYWLVPRIAGEFAQRIVRVTEHQTCPLVPDLRRNTRSVIALAPLQLLGWYSCYHAEHHLSPNTPFHAMPRLHQRLRDDIAHMSPSYIAAHQEIQQKLALNKA